VFDLGFDVAGERGRGENDRQQQSADHGGQYMTRTGDPGIGVAPG
jgi:hypothetical protein